MESARTELTLLDAYRQMLTIRRFEEAALELGGEGLISGSIHVCIGQEAIPVGARAALTDQDRVMTTYRGHGWAVAAGVPLAGLLGELCQRADGINGGRGGSPHFTASKWGILGENSIVGAGVPIAAGVAMAAQFRNEDRVALTSIGEGAMSQGSVHEGLVFAAARSLPLIVLVENNEWSEMTRSSTLLRIGDLAERAGGYGVNGQVVDGTDPLAVQEAVAKAADLARSGAGPVLLEAKTVRLAGHYNGDVEHYRSKAEREEQHSKDPLAGLRERLLESKEASADQLDEVDAAAAREIEDSIARVRAMEAPDPATARDHLLAPSSPVQVGPMPSEGEELTYIKAVGAALDDALDEDAEVLVYGEDLGVAGGIFGATRGLQEKFGEARVFDTPIAESAILGSAVGAAMEGLRPVVEIMWADFMLVAFDQLVNQAANVRYVSRSTLSAPMTVRTQQGATPGSCAQHSQNLEALLTHIPGLKVGLPATPHDAYEMLRAAIVDPDPVIVIEARGLYQTKGFVDREIARETPVGGARVHREGADVVLLTWGTMLGPTLAAHEKLAAEGIDAGVVDLRWLSPLDDETIEMVVRGSHGRVAVVHEANLTGGFGAEIAARIQADHFDYLDHPVVRIGAPDSRIPSAPALQGALLPNADAIARTVSGLVGSRAPSAVDSIQ